MILRRYGSWYHSVRTNFNPSALTEIGFQRDRALSISASDLEANYARVADHEVVAEAGGEVQRHAERDLLARMDEAIERRVAALEPGQLLVVQNERDDWPKTRERREAVVGGGENRFRFQWSVEPPLRLGVYAEK